MAEYLTITPGEVPTNVLHGFLLGSTAPRPIGFASTINQNGEPNLAPFSFYNVFSAKPPICIFSPARRVRDNSTKDTLQNVYEVPEVVINLVNYAMVEQMNLASMDYPRGVNEFTKAGFTPLASDLVRPFRVLESPAQYECKVMEIKPMSSAPGAGNLVICEILKVHLNREILNAQGQIDPHKIDLVARMGADFYCRASGEAVFEVKKPGLNVGVGIDLLPDYIRSSHILTGNDLGRLGSEEGIPTSEEVESWRNQNQEMLAGLQSTEALHEKAKEMIRQNQRQEALKLLLNQPYQF